MSFINNGLKAFFDLLHEGIRVVGITNPNVSYGLSIILFTLIVRAILLPLNLKQMRSQAKMQEMQPEIKKIQDKYKNDPQKSQAEMMKLYKEKGANPMGGCLPLIIQLPILWALFYVFRNINTGGKVVSFLWIKDLFQPESTYIFGMRVSILALLSGITQYISTRFMPASGDPAQAKQASTMNVGMSIFMVFMAWNFTSALVLYWVVNNLVQLAQNLLVKKIHFKEKQAAA